MTEYKLKTIVEHWQKVLRLQDWDIDARFARFREMQSQDGGIPWGRILINRLHRRGEIAILHPDDYEHCDDDGCQQPHGGDEIETTIIHELLHIYIHAKNEDEPSSVEEEQTINALAGAFASLSDALKGDDRE